MFESAVHEDEMTSGEVTQGEAGYQELGATGEYTGEGEWSPETAYEGAYESGFEGEDPFLGNILGAVGSALGLGEGEEEGEWSPESAYEGAYESGYEGEDPFLGNILGAVGSALGLGEGEEEAGYESAGYEGESPETAYEGAYESGFEGEDPFLGNILGAVGSALGLGEGEEEAGYESGYESVGYEGEWSPESAYEGAYESGYETNGEWSPETTYEAGYEGEDPFFGGILKAARRFLPRLLPIARRIAPQVVGALRGMLPGPIGAIASQVLGEGEAAAIQAEERLFGTGEAAYEVGGSHPEAVMTEILAAEAANAQTDSEASSVIAATLPITITIMGGRRPLRPVVPVMAQATSRIVRVLRRRGPAGRQLIRLVPAIQRQAVATLNAASRAGVPITGRRAVAAMMSAANRVLTNPHRFGRVVVRNAALSRRPIALRPMSYRVAPYRRPIRRAG
jgi:hypothetical protein